MRLTSGRHCSAFTLVELLSTIAIIAILATLTVFFISSCITWVRKTNNQRTLTILNENLDRYRTLAGMRQAHSLEGPNNAAKVTAVINALQKGITVNGQRRNFLNDIKSINTAQLYGTGSGKTFAFCGYGSTLDGSMVGTTGAATPSGGTANMVIFNIDNTNEAAYSADATSWTAITLPTAQNWTSPVYGNGRYFCVGYDTDVGVYSTDGIHWTQVTLPTTGPVWMDPQFIGGKFVLLSQSGTLASSADAIHWTYITLPHPSGWNSTWSAWSYIKQAGSVYLVVDWTGSSQCGLTSTNLSTWTSSPLPSTLGWYPNSLNGKFYATLFTDRRYITSTNGSAWSAIQYLPVGYTYNGITYANGKYFSAISTSSNKMATSTDGATWSLATMPSSNYWNNPLYLGGIYISTTYGGIIATSADGATWQQRTITTSIPAYDGIDRDFSYIGGKIIGGPQSTKNATVIYSSDAVTWHAAALPSESWWSYIATSL